VLLVEIEPRLAASARRAAQSAGLLHVEVVEADAGTTTPYAPMVPADVVVASGLFSHLSDADVRQTIETLPVLCDRNAFVIWTRDRSEPDLTPAIRAWFVQAGFQDIAYSRFVEGNAGVGMARLAAAPRPFQPGVRLFRSLIDRAQSGVSAGSAGEMRSG
jgi:hypothetical protein